MTSPDTPAVTAASQMPKLAMAYVKVIDAINYRVGRLMMYGIFAMIAVLLWSSIAKAAFTVPPFWTLEVAQFMLVAYYLLGGPYSIQLGSNVRMDLFYHNWSVRKKAWVDSFTILLLIFYLAVLLFGGIDSTMYAVEYQERSPSLWRPLMWPIKTIMCIGIFLMLLQAISELIKDVARLRGAMT